MNSLVVNLVNKGLNIMVVQIILSLSVDTVMIHKRCSHIMPSYLVAVSLTNQISLSFSCKCFDI